MEKIQEKIKKIKEAIWNCRPILGNIMQTHLGQSLYSYAADFLDINKNDLLKDRQKELFSTLELIIEERLGGKIAKEVINQLSHKPLVSTADHHSPIQHPFWVNSNIISALPYNEAKKDFLKYLVVFSFSSVSLNNASGYARGIMFHQDDASIGDMVKIPIMPDKNKMSIVYATRAFGQEDLNRAFNELNKKVKENIISEERGEEILKILKNYFATESVYNSKNFSEQITKINYSLWPTIFHHDEKSCEGNCAGNCKPPDLVYIEIESLVRELLVKHHLDNEQSLINKFLFDKKFQELIPDYFDDIPGAFSKKDGWGTYLFWAVDDKQHRVKLSLTDGVLHSLEKRHVFSFDPISVKKALESGEIFPSMMLCYLIVSLYYGIKCLGGFCQVNDLTFTKEAWQKMLKKLDNEQEANAVEPVQTKELGGDGMVLSYLRSKDGKIQPATGFDMIMKKADTCFDRYEQRAKKVTIGDMMGPMLPEMYTVLYNQFNRDPELASLTSDEIIEEFDLKSKL